MADDADPADACYHGVCQLRAVISGISLYRHVPPRPPEPVTASGQAHPRRGEDETTE
jgi:hypothetical protein